MSTTHITTSQRAIAYALLVSQLLTSCGWNETILPSKKQDRTIQQEQYMPKLKVLDLNEEEGPTQDAPLASILKDVPHDSTLEQPIQPQQDLALIANSTDQLVHPREVNPKQTQGKEKKEHSFGHASLKPVKKKPTSLPKQSLATNSISQLATKHTQEKTSSLVTVLSQETIDPTLGKPAIEIPISYGPYTIKGGHQVLFIQRDRQWVAQVKESLPKGISRKPMILPVYLEFGLSMEEVSKYPHMDIVFPTKSNDGKGYVVCTKQAGLPGGMKEGDKCIYREDQMIKENGRWICPGPGKHPRNGPQPSDSQHVPIDVMVKETFHGLKQLGSFGGMLDQLPRGVKDEKRDEERQHQQRERERILDLYEYNKSIYNDIDRIKEELINKYGTEITLNSLEETERYKADLEAAIEEVKDLEGNLRIEAGRGQGLAQKDLRENERSEFFKPSKTYEQLAELQGKATEIKRRFVILEGEIYPKLEAQVDKIFELSARYTIEGINQVLAVSRELLSNIDQAIKEVRNKNLGTEKTIQNLKKFRTEVEEKGIKRFTRRKEVIIPHLEQVKEFALKIGLEAAYEDIVGTFGCQVARSQIGVIVRAIKEKGAIPHDFIEKEIFPDDKTVRLDKFLERWEILAVWLKKENGQEIKVEKAIGLKATNAGLMTMEEIDKRNYISLVDKFNNKLQPIADLLNSLVEDEKDDPVAILEQAKKAKQGIQEAIQAIKAYETKCDKTKALNGFAEQEKVVDGHITINQHQIFADNLNEEMAKDIAKMNILIEEDASPAAIIQEAKIFQGKLRERMQRLDPNECIKDKALQDLQNIIQEIDGVIKEQEEKMKGGKLLVNPTGKGIRNDSGGLGHFGASRGVDSNGEKRLHEGIDFQSVDGQDVVSPIQGKAINSFFFKDKKKTIKIPTIVITPTDLNIGFNKLELLYVGPIEERWRNVNRGDIVGQSVNLQSLGYPSNVGQHVHLQIKLNGIIVDPRPYFPGLK